jgi:hypothetical protein
MIVSGQTRDAAGKDLAGLRHKSAEDIWVFVINSFQGDVNPALGHRTIVTAEVGAALSCFRLHKEK